MESERRSAKNRLAFNVARSCSNRKCLATPQDEAEKEKTQNLLIVGCGNQAGVEDSTTGIGHQTCS